MLGVMLISTVYIFPMITNYGQNELESFSKMAAAETSNELVTFGFARKYSLMNDFDKKIIYITTVNNENIEKFKQATKPNKNQKIYVIVENDLYETFKPTGLFNNFNTVEKKKRYILLVK